MSVDRDQAETAALFEECYRKFIGGDGRALLEAVALSMACRMPAPEWVAEGFMSIWEEACGGQVASWEERFGKPWGYGTRSAARSRPAVVWWRVDELVTSGRSITNQLFEEIGAELGMSRAKVSRLFYEHERFHREIGEPTVGRRRRSALFSDKD
jgi:hypothetical protein